MPELYDFTNYEITQMCPNISQNNALKKNMVDAETSLRKMELHCTVRTTMRNDFIYHFTLCIWIYSCEVT